MVKTLIMENRMKIRRQFEQHANKGSGLYPRLHSWLFELPISFGGGGMRDGWIKTHRKIIDWQWYKKSEMVHLFTHLLMSANHAPQQWQGITIDKGQIATGIHSLSNATGISPRTIRTCLSRLEVGGEISRKTTSKYSIITISKYCDYQSIENNIDKQTTSKRQANDNKQECKECKEEKDNVGQQEETAPRPRINIPFSEITKILNDKAGTQFKPNSEVTKRHIKARWAEGFRINDFEAVIESKVYEWGTNPEMVQYLRPQTLFGPKFESYLQNAVISQKPKSENVYTLPDLEELKRKKQAARLAGVQ